MVRYWLRAMNQWQMGDTIKKLHSLPVLVILFLATVHSQLLSAGGEKKENNSDLYQSAILILILAGGRLCHI